jgi:ATP-binding cassette subfamily B protein
VVSAGGVAAGLAPLALKRLVDAIGSGPTPAAAIFWPIAAYGVALLLQRLGEQLQAYCYGRGELALIRRFNVAAFEHLLRLPFTAHLDARPGALAQALAEGVLGIRLILSHLVVTGLPVLVQLTVAGVVVGSELGANGALILVAALGAYTGVFAVGVQRLDAPARGVSAAHIAAAGALADSLMSIEALKTFVAEDQYAERYDQALGRTESQWRIFHRRRLEQGTAVALVFSATLAFGLVAISRDALRGEVSLGAVVMLNAYLLQIVRPLELLGFAVRDLGQGRAYLASLSRLLAQPGEGRRPRETRAASKAPAELEFENVSFSFDAARTTLQGLSFHAPPGATLALVGPSGAGKSSIVRLILGLYAPSGGVIRLDGRPISTYALSDLRSQIAVVAQDTILLDDSLAANIALGSTDAKPPEIADAVASAHLTDLVDLLPEGLRTRVGGRGLKLSGGERQRVAIARAAFRRARLLLLDEATASLDPVTEQAVWRDLAVLGEGATRLIVSHRLAMTRQADEILVLDKGEIVERGDHRSLLDAGGLYARLWHEQHIGPSPYPGPQG